MKVTVLDQSCTTPIAGPVGLSTTAATPIITTGRQLAANTGSETLCFKVALDTGVLSAQQNKSIMFHSSSRRRQPEVTMSDHTTPGSSRSARAGRELALTIGAVAGLICVLAAAASMLFGIKPLVFRSGSMSPEITTGSLALARTVPATDLSVGDIVSVVNGQGTRITHRVYELDQQAGNSVTVTLKGDANAKPDVEPYFITEADRISSASGAWATQLLGSPAHSRSSSAERWSADW